MLHANCRYNIMEIDITFLSLFIIGMSAALAISIWHPFAFSAIIIVLNERFLGILPYKFGDYDLIRGATGPVLIILAIFLQVLFRMGEFRKGLNNRDGSLSYMPFVLIILGVVAFSTMWGGVYIYNQSLKSLIFQPIVFSYYFLYVYLCFFSPDKKQIMRFLVVMVTTAVLVGVLMLIDSVILNEALIFKYANISERVGLIRIVVFMTGLAWAYYFALASADEEKYSLRSNILYAGIALFLLTIIVFIQIDRQSTLAFFLTTILVALSMKAVRKLVIAWVMALFLLIIIANPDFSFEKSALGKLVNLTSAEAKTRESTIGIRFKAIEYYYEHFSNTYGLGFGVLGSRREYRNPVSQGLAQGYNLNDLSLAGIIFRFGIPGLLLIIATAWKLLRDTGRILKTRDPAVRSITRGIRYTVLHLVILFPLTTFLFYPEKAVFFAIMFFVVERLLNIVNEENPGGGA
jgi:hypothetical protein